jgi:PAS domain S-box-containing protein
MNHLKTLLLLLCICFGVGSCVVANAQQVRDQKRVLVIWATRKEAPAPAVAERLYQKEFTEGLGGKLDYYSEFIDVARFPDQEYQAVLRQLLQHKYKDLPPDLVIGTSGTANDFITRYRSELFPNAAALMVLSPGSVPPPNTAGIRVPINMRGTIDLILALQPGAKRIFVVSGGSEFDKYYEAVAREQFKQFEDRVEFTFLSALPMEELLSKVAKLPVDSVIYYLTFVEEPNGNRFLPLDSLDKVASVANVPIYCWHEVAMDHGIVGGDLQTMESITTNTTGLALRILKGEKPETLPVIDVDPEVMQVDWRQLQRWGIDESRIPAGAVVLFKQPTIWQQYKWEIIGAVSLIIVETFLIAFLLVSRSRQRRAEAERERFASLAESEHRHLDEVVSNVPGIVWESRIDADGPARSEQFVSQHVENMLGYSVEEWMSEPRFWLSIIPEEEREETLRRHDEILKSGKDGVVQFRWIAKDGRFLWVEGHLSVIFDDNKMPVGLRGVTLDISERKSAEEGLRNALLEVGQLKDQLQKENIYLREQVELDHRFEEIIGNSDEIRYVLFKIQQVAPTDASVLVQGETGTGKELVARAIHSASSRKYRPMVKINCAALPANLIESELFGHEKGAFTGAQAKKIGRFELADGTTLFLDEIGELPLELQSKLLRVLQEGEFERLGSSQTRKIDVRIIAATNRNLKVEVQNGLFREDLWYRLNVFPITVPPLRQRKSDIALLVNFFVNRSNRKLGRIVKTISPQTLQTLQNYYWPGNVRELANIIDRALINSNGTVLQLADKLEVESVAANGDGIGKALFKLEDVERDHIIAILNVCDWRVEGTTGAASILGINSSTLRSRMNKLGIKRPKPTSSTPSGPQKSTRSSND